MSRQEIALPLPRQYLHETGDSLDRENEECETGWDGRGRNKNLIWANDVCRFVVRWLTKQKHIWEGILMYGVSKKGEWRVPENGMLTLLGLCYRAMAIILKGDK